MIFRPLPRKDEQEMQEEGNDYHKVSLPTSLWSSPSLCAWDPMGITLFYEWASRGQSPASSLLAGDGICFLQGKSLAGHTLMPALRQEVDP